MALFAARARLDQPACEAARLDGTALAASSNGARWERSLLASDQLQLLSIYEASSAAQVADVVGSTDLMYSDPEEVQESLPGRFLEGLDNEPGPDSRLFLILRQFTEWMTETELEAAKYRSSTCISTFPGLSWVRSYVVNEQHPNSEDPRVRPRTMCLYRSPSEVDIRQHAELVRVPCDEIWAVEELLP